MIRTIIETNVLLYVMAATGMLGILGQLFLNRNYRIMLREAVGTQTEKRDFMKRLVWKYQTDCRRSDGRVDTTLFVRRQLLDCRFWHMSLHQWKRFCAGWYFLSMALAAAGLIYGYQIKIPAIHMRNLLRMSAAVTVVSAAAALWLDTRYKETSLRTVLENYLAHSGVGRNYERVDMEAAAQQEKQAKGVQSPLEHGRETGGVQSAEEYENEGKDPAQIVDIQDSFRDGEAQNRVKKAPPIVGIRRKKEAAQQSRASRQSAQQTETRAQRDKRELQENLSRIREGTRETAAELEKSRERNREILRQMDSQEQERIIRDVLAEFLA